MGMSREIYRANRKPRSYRARLDVTRIRAKRVG
jgi:hypothetical protein